MPFPDEIGRGVRDELLDDISRGFEMQRKLATFPRDDWEILNQFMIGRSTEMLYLESCS
jgi:hypothetical protein